MALQPFVWPPLSFALRSSQSGTTLPSFGRTKICTRYRKHYKRYLKITKVLLKYSTFEGGVFMFSWAKEVQN